MSSHQSTTVPNTVKKNCTNTGALSLQDQKLVQSKCLSIIDQLLHFFFMEEFNVALTGIHKSESFSLCSFVSPADIRGKKRWRINISSERGNNQNMACKNCGERFLPENLLKLHAKECE